MFDIDKVLLFIEQGSSGAKFIMDIVEAIYTALTCTTTERFDAGNAIHGIGVDACIARGV